MEGTSTIACCIWHRLTLLLYKTFAMIIFLSLKCFAVFFSMELLNGFLNAVPLEMGGGSQIGMSTYAMVRGAKFCHFAAYVLLE